MYTNELSPKQKYERELRNRIRINRKNKLLKKRIKIIKILGVLFVVLGILASIALNSSINAGNNVGTIIITVVAILLLIAYWVYGFKFIHCPHCGWQGIDIWHLAFCPHCTKTLVFSEETEALDKEMQEKGEGVPFD